MKREHLRIVRYILVQVAGYGLDMGAFIVMVRLFRFDPVLANLIAKIIAAIFAFYAHRSFTFGLGSISGKLGQATRYFSLVAINIPIASILLAGLLQIIPFAELAKFLADLICAALNYWLTSRFVFRSGASRLRDKSIDGSRSSGT